MLDMQRLSAIPVVNVTNVGHDMSCPLIHFYLHLNHAVHDAESFSNGHPEINAAGVGWAPPVVPLQLPVWTPHAASRVLSEGCCTAAG